MYSNTINNKTMDVLKRHRMMLLAGGMLLDELPLATIRFMLHIYDVFLDKKFASCADMSKAYNCTPQAARQHVHKLTERGYLNREHYRAWSLSEDYIMTFNVGHERSSQPTKMIA